MPKLTSQGEHVDDQTLNAIKNMSKFTPEMDANVGQQIVGGGIKGRSVASLPNIGVMCRAILQMIDTIEKQEAKIKTLEDKVDAIKPLTFE
jgi:hypothetical protein